MVDAAILIKNKSAVDQMQYYCCYHFSGSNLLLSVSLLVVSDVEPGFQLDTSILLSLLLPDSPFSKPR